MRRRSHLIVRLIPENIMGSAPVIDFVELCGSELAASPSTASNTHENEKDRKFATSSFNSLSQALLAAAFKQPFKKESHTNLTKMLCQSLLSRNAKVVLVANLSNTRALIKHSFTALKFSSKIREAIYKRFARIEQKQRHHMEDQIKQDLDVINKELQILKGKLINSSTELADGDPLLI